MAGMLKNLKSESVLWAAASMVGIAILGASPLIAAPSQPSDPAPAPGTRSVDDFKLNPRVPTPEELRKGLGVPLEDAGGGTHALLRQNAHAARASLEAAGYIVNQIRLNYDPMSADIYVARETPSSAAQNAAQAAANGAKINFCVASRTTAEAMVQQERIGADWDSLAHQGINLSTTGLIDDGATVLVRLTDGTPEQADYILKTYGPDGLKVQIAPGPEPREA